MNTTQKSVLEFMMKAGQPICTGNMAELGARLITEEALETVTALGFNAVSKLGGGWQLMPITFANVGRKPVDLIEVIDGACDTQYVLYWTLNMLGIDGEIFMEEVCNNNLLKVIDPKFDENGKLKKPAGHKPPDIEGILENADCYFVPATMRKKDGTPYWGVVNLNKKVFDTYMEAVQVYTDGFFTVDNRDELAIVAQGKTEKLMEFKFS